MTPLQTLFEAPGSPPPWPLPEALSQLYGSLSFSPRPDGPLVLGNFVSTLDGVVSLASGQSGGAAISGHSQQDLMLMGLLRAVADVVIEGAGTLRAAPKSILTAAHVYPALAEAYAEFRQRLGKAAQPLNVIVSESGDLDLSLRLFQSGEVPVLILTGNKGAERLATAGLPPKVKLEVVAGEERLEGAALIAAMDLSPGTVVVAEGGPHLLGALLKGHCLHELFLTLAPQVAGRDGIAQRPGFVAGQLLAPEDPRWGSLVGVKKGGEHLFLRYKFS